MQAQSKPYSLGEKRHLLWREIDCMQHRRPDPDCPLCALWGIPYDEANKATHGRQHLHAELLWNEWDGLPGWEERVCAVAAELGVECSKEQVRRHFSRHQLEQPARSKRLNRAHALRLVEECSPRQRRILQAVFRQRKLSREQILDLFYRGDYDETSAKTLATRELTELVRANLLVRWYPPLEWTQTKKEQILKGQVFYFLGREATPYIEQTEQAKVWKSSYLVFAREVGRQALLHDTKSTDLYAALARGLARHEGVLEIAPGKVTDAFLNTANWYGPRQLTLRFWDARAQRQIDMVPDGLAAIALERAGYEVDDLPACQLPFFYEFDHGSRREHQVSRQLLQYHNLARSGLVGRLFPDLDVAGYAPPVVMVFADEEKMERVIGSFKRRAERNGYRSGAPVFVTTEREWLADPFAPGILRDAWEGRGGTRRLSLVEALIASSQRLLKPLCLVGPLDTLRYDPTVIPRLNPQLQPESTRYQH